MKTIKVLGTAHVLFNKETKPMLNEVKEYLASLDLKLFDIISETGYEKNKVRKNDEVLLDEFVLGELVGNRDVTVGVLDVKGGQFNNDGSTIMQDVLDNSGDLTTELYNILGRLFGMTPADVFAKYMHTALTDANLVTLVTGRFTSGAMVDIDVDMKPIMEAALLPFLQRMEDEVGIADESVIPEMEAFSQRVLAMSNAGEIPTKNAEIEAFVMREDTWDLPLDDTDKVFVVGAKHIPYIEEYYSSRGFSIL